MAPAWSGEGFPLSRSLHSLRSLCSLMVEGGKELSAVSFIKALLPLGHEGLRSKDRPPQTPSYLTSELQDVKLEGPKHSQHSRGQGFSLSTWKNVVAPNHISSRFLFLCLMIRDMGVATASTSATEQSRCSKMTFCFLTPSHQLRPLNTFSSFSRVFSSPPCQPARRTEDQGSTV